MNTYNVVVTVSTTVCIDAESPDDAIEKVSQALNNGDTNMSADVANNIGYSIRNGHYEVTDAIPMDEDYDEDSGNEEDDESEEWEQHNRREVGDFHPIMEFLHSAGEQLLREDIRRYDIKPTVIRTKDEMHEFYRTQPDEMILAALVEVDDKVSGKHYCSIRVWCSGHEIKTRSMGSYYVLIDILPTAKAGGFLHQPPLHSNRGCCVLHDVRQALLPVCPTVRYVFIKRTFAQALYAKY